MTTKRKIPVLRWRKRKGEWRAGPFRIIESDGLGLPCIKGFGEDGDGSELADSTGHAFGDVDGAKKWLNTLASRIIAATKGRHGK